MNKNHTINHLKATRDSSLELLRIIMMLLIIAHHYVVNSGLISVDGPIFSNALSVRSISLLLFGAWGKIGINCFVLITGYFMCKSHITTKKFFQFFAEVMFYKFVIYSIFVISGYESFSLSGFINLLLPITFIDTNFVECYLVFYLCIPFLNILIHNLQEKQHIYLLLICSFTYILIGTLPKFHITMNYVSWFIVLYFIASYIRLYPKKMFSKTGCWGILALISILLSVISVISCTWLSTKTDVSPYYFVSDSNTFLAVSTGLCLFMFFKNLQLTYNKYINTCASTTFGILLIHANSDTMRTWLWKDCLNCLSAYNSDYLIIHAIGSIFIIFIICSIIDFVRITYLEKPLFNHWDIYETYAHKYYKKLENIIFQHFNIEQ